LGVGLTLPVDILIRQAPIILDYFNHLHGEHDGRYLILLLVVMLDAFPRISRELRAWVRVLRSRR
jgi:hypothetical protein